uniref:Replication-associated protein n=1 Tax=Fringilla montifringilla CRESS-DNA-virus sp. TaxID=2815044 RepID=A0A8A4XBN7_9VIRU|nr:MAG: replication-associated protein [Fringilla montifringilla CRESS-DNA-virus sp.]
MGEHGTKQSTSSEVSSNQSGTVKQSNQGNKARYWILTIPHHEFTPYLPPGAAFITGQLELGESGYLHWQFVILFETQVRLSAVRKLLGPWHAEPTKSVLAEAYCHKEATGVPGTGFILGQKPFKRCSAKDWSDILRSAQASRFEDIPPDVFVRYYGNIKRIAVESAQPVGIERTCTVFWGPTGTGKSKLAWEQAGLDAYPKDPCTKFWDGYRGQACVVVDEFRGSIGISHLLRWLDRYPVLVEIKGSSTVFKAEKIWFTSNLHPREWYKDVDGVTIDALMRRLEVVEML